MIRLVTGGLFLLPLLGLLPGAASAATDFQDIPYLQARINQVLESEPTGAEVEWHNQATGNAGVIRVLKTYFPSPDAPCRDYERTTRQPGGGESLVRGTGCRDASGRWGLRETEEGGASGPEHWGPVAPGGEAAAGAPAAGGQAGQTGGQVGAQTRSGSQVQPQSGGGEQAGVVGQSQSGATTFVLPNQGEPDPAAAQSAPETPEPAAPAPRESAPSLPEFDMPTRSD